MFVLQTWNLIVYTSTVVENSYQPNYWCTYGLVHNRFFDKYYLMPITNIWQRVSKNQNPNSGMPEA